MPLSDDQLDAFVASQPHAPFLQSSGWKQFQTRCGRTTHLFSFEKDRLDATALCVEMQAPGGFRYWFCPRGPVIADPRVATAFLDDLISAARQQSVDFLRFEPSVPFTNSRLRRSRPIHPSDTLLLDLSVSEQTLLSNMKPKTRYNLRLSERHGVLVNVRSDAAAVSAFASLMKQTSQRQGIRSHDVSYYRTMLQVLGKVGKSSSHPLSVRLYCASIKDSIIAANLMMFFGDTVTYLFGGSDYEHRSLMAPVLLQWRAINDAKAAGFHWYDFWGVAPSEASGDHGWAGVTRFKLGFGGTRMSLPGTFDLPIATWKYYFYRFLRSLRK